MVIKARFKGVALQNATYIVIAPRTPMISGIPAVVTIDKNNNCKLIVRLEFAINVRLG
jgi:hypothetical protein